MEKIREYFERIVPLSDRDWQLFSSKLTRHEFPKKAVLLKTGQTENHLSFIETGIARYYIPKDENDVTFTFAFADSFISAYDSFLTRQPSRYQIQVLTDTTLWRLTYDDL